MAGKHQPTLHYVWLRDRRLISLLVLSKLDLID